MLSWVEFPGSRAQDGDICTGNLFRTALKETCEEVREEIEVGTETKQRCSEDWPLKGALEHEPHHRIVPPNSGPIGVKRAGFLSPCTRH